MSVWMSKLMFSDTDLFLNPRNIQASFLRIHQNLIMYEKELIVHEKDFNFTLTSIKMNSA